MNRARQRAQITTILFGIAVIPIFYANISFWRRHAQTPAQREHRRIMGAARHAVQQARITKARLDRDDDSRTPKARALSGQLPPLPDRTQPRPLRLKPPEEPVYEWNTNETLCLGWATLEMETYDIGTIRAPASLESLGVLP